MKKGEKKEITLEDVARSVEDLAVMTQNGFVGLEMRMNERFEEMDYRFEEMDRCFDRVENILYRGHDNRLERVEDKPIQVEKILGKKLA